MKIQTTYLHPPIPAREFDWCAFDEEGGRIGYGPTRLEAVCDLIEQMTDELLAKITTDDLIDVAIADLADQ